MNSLDVLLLVFFMFWTFIGLVIICEIVIEYYMTFIERRRSKFIIKKVKGLKK